MSKKTFQNAPLPKLPDAAIIDRFVESGPGRDRISGKQETQNSVDAPNRVPADKEIHKSAVAELRKAVNTDVVRLTVDIPRTLHRRYKASCSLRGIKMNEEIRMFIEHSLEEGQGA